MEPCVLFWLWELVFVKIAVEPQKPAPNHTAGEMLWATSTSAVIYSIDTVDG